MRTTIRLNDQLLAEAKKLAAETQRSLTSLIEDALREVILRRRHPARRGRVKLPTFRGTGFLPGIDLDNSAALLEHMEKVDAADRR